MALQPDLNGWGGAMATAAQAEFINGAGNVFQHGIRCLELSDDRKKLYLGMANNASLMN